MIEYILTFIYWSVLLFFTQTHLLPPVILDVIVKVFDSEDAAASILIALFSINIGLACVVFGMGIYAEFPMDALIKWTILTPYFGFLSAGRMIKIAAKRRIKLDQDDPIG